MAYKKRRYYNKKTTGMKKTLKKAVDKEIRKEMRKDVEIKQITFSVAPGLAQTLTQAPTACVNITPQIDQGTAQGQRVSNRIMIHKITMKGFVRNSAAAAPTTGRIIIFRDLQCNAVLPISSQVLQEVGATTAENSNYRIDFQHRFRILKDFRFPLNNAGGATDQPVVRMFGFTKKYVEGKGPILTYQNLPGSTTGVLANYQGGQIFGLFLTEVAAGQPFCWYDLDIQYTDA